MDYKPVADTQYSTPLGGYKRLEGLSSFAICCCRYYSSFKVIYFLGVGVYARSVWGAYLFFITAFQQ